MLENFEQKLQLADLNRLKEKIEKARNILIFSHQNPDMDAIGSMMALVRYLRQQDKECQIFLPQPLAERFFYLREPVAIIGKDDLRRGQEDLVIGLDCSNLDWSGAENSLSAKQKEGIFFINIDHHPKSTYADLNIVETTSAATALILYEIFKRWGARIDNKMATQLLAGIMADTNGFSNSATSMEAYRAAGELLALGANYNEVMKKVQKNEPDNWPRLWAKVLSRLVRNDKMKLAYAVVLPDEVEEGGVALEGITNFLSNLSEMSWTMVLKENNSEEIKVSLRSLSNKIDVAKIAAWFGGGGHVKSAGFAIRGRLEREGNYWQIV